MDELSLLNFKVYCGFAKNLPVTVLTFKFLAHAL